MNALCAYLRRATRQRLRLRRLCAVLAMVLATVAWMRATYAQMQASEVQIKAAFIYNFALFTTWPTDAMLADAPMVLCVAAEQPLLAALEQLTGKPVRGHRLEIRKINDGAVGCCHVLVLDARSAAGVRLNPATPVLTVGDGRNSALAPMIALALQDKRVVFDIDAGAARQAGLQLSSQLLRLARSVQ